MRKACITATFFLLATAVKAQFSIPTEVTDNYNVSWSYTVDFDQDGDTDIIGCDKNLHLFRNDGNAVFEKIALTDTWMYHGGIEINIGDMNGDGFPDIITNEPSWAESPILCHVNDGNGGISSIETISTDNDGVYRLSLTDMNSDGLLDLVGGHTGTVMLIRKNNGDFTFTEESITLSYIFVGVGDFNGDNRPDAITWATGFCQIRYNDVNEGFSDSTSFSMPIGTSPSPQVFDVDNDGDNDIIWKGGSYNVFVTKNLGGGLFSAPSTTTIPDDTRFIIKDIDLDNDPDLMIFGWTFIDEPYYGYMLNNGTGSFASSVDLELAATPALDVYDSGIEAVEDFDGDGDLDIFASDNIFFRANAPLDYAHGEHPFEELATQWIGTIDANDDGIEDLLHVRSDGLCYTLGQGNNIFAQSQTLIGSPTPGDDVDEVDKIQVCDLNNDGKDDIFYRFQWNTSATLHGAGFFINNGDGTFTRDTLLAPEYLNDVIIARFDNDAYPDIVENDGNELRWRKNLGNGTFSPPVSLYIDGTIADDINCIDMDGDGDNDVFFNTVQYAQNYQMSYLPNNGNGTTAPPVNFLQEGNGSCMKPFHFMDMNGDGNLDITYSFAPSQGSIKWWKVCSGDGAGNYTITAAFPSSYTQHMKIGDIDHDGRPDICGTASSRFFVHFQDEVGQFSPRWCVPDLVTVPVHHFLFSGADCDMLFTMANNTHGIYLTRNHFRQNLKGRLYVDMDLNGQPDPTDLGIPGKANHLLPADQYYYTGSNGFFAAPDIAGGPNQLIPPQTIPNFDLVTTPPQYDFTVQDGGDSLFQCAFGYTPNAIFEEIDPMLTGIGHRCNSVVRYWIDFVNMGTTNPAGIIDLELDPLVSFVSADISPDSISGQHIYWHYDSLDYFEQGSIDLLVQMPDFNAMGDTLNSTLNVMVTDSSGTILSVYTDELYGILTCGFDPNDKKADPAGIGPEGYIPVAQEWMEYTVRFQNTGNDTAFSIVILDQLDDDFEWNTLQPMTASHPVEVNVGTNGMASFVFDFIHLPDSNVNEQASHGFIRYRIRLKENLQPGDQLHNTANIYFDFNPAVVTNTTVNTLYTCDDPFALVTIPTAICQYETINTFFPATSFDTVTWYIPGITIQNGGEFHWESDTSGNFNLQLTRESHLCSNDTLYNILIHPAPGVYVNPLSVDTLCLQNNAMALPAATPAGGFYSGPGISDSQFYPETAGPGTHQLLYTFTDQNNCSAADSVTLTVIDCLGTNELTNSAISVFPNPSNGKISVLFTQPPTGFYDICVTNTMGQTILSRTGMTGNAQVIDLAAAGKGIYLLKITQSTGTAEIVRVVLE